MRRLAFLLPFAVLSACTTRPEPAPAPVAVAVPAPPPAPFAGMGTVRVPARLADGGYATPNRLVASPAAALWHLRSGLNVAALSCRGPDEATIIAGYNALLASHAAEFAAAYRATIADYGSPDRFDTAMTGLYNYFALAPARDGLCRAAVTVLITLPTSALAQAAPGALAQLDAPYLAVFAAQDAWTAARFADRTPVTALSVAFAAPRLTPDQTVLTRP